ncbi:MAG TPA: hypothetical protein VGO02_09485 [Burkholderiales bacterium]|nr:hypothetical protein [Burkholderiales bacterium]
MRQSVGFTLLLAMLWGCSHTELVSVPPKMSLKSYGTLGIVDFASNSDPAINSRATREFQAQIHAAQPGTRLVELGSRETLLAAAGGRQLDVEALRKIAAKYGVDAIFLGDITYSDPVTNVKIGDLSKLEGGMHTEVRGDMSARLVETGTGASVWSSSSWARRQVNRLSISSEQGISGSTGNANPQAEMLPALIGHLTSDFRPTSTRQQVK